MGSSKRPRTQPLPPPPPPPSFAADPDVLEAGQEQRRKARGARGRSSTILTGGLGTVSSSAPSTSLSRTTLGGA